VSRNSPLRLILTGASSLLGWEFLRQAPEDWDILATLHRNQDLPPGIKRPAVLLDITSHEQVCALVTEFRPQIIVHLSSRGDLDYCKAHPEEAWSVNVEGTRNLLECSRLFRPAFLFLSTMYVFDGTHPPYDEEAATHPINEYARTKLAAEKLVLEESAQPTILRPMAMYGWHSRGQRMNWVTWLLGKLRNGEQVRVVNDVYNNHLWAGDAARAVRMAIEKRTSGIFHVGGAEISSRYEFSLDVARVFNLGTQLIVPVTSEHFHGIAQRPANSTCSIRKLRDVLGVEPVGNRTGLLAMKAAEVDINAQA